MWYGLLRSVFADLGESFPTVIEYLVAMGTDPQRFDKATLSVSLTKTERTAEF